MIKITKELLSKWFDQFNAEFFNNELKKTDFIISNNRGRFGQFSSRTWTIEISTYWVRTERDYKNTFIHEMAHTMVRQKYGRFAKSHGYEWKEIANRINRQMGGKYGTIQRVGGGQDSYSIRKTNTEKFVLFTDYSGKLSIAKYRDDEYVNRLKRFGGVKEGSTIYYLVSDNQEMSKFRLRKVNTRSLYWSCPSMSVDEIIQKSTLVKQEEYKNLKKAA